MLEYLYGKRFDSKIAEASRKEGDRLGAGILVYVMRLCWLAVGRIHHKRMTYTNCCLYRVEPPDDKQ